MRLIMILVLFTGMTFSLNTNNVAQAQLTDLCADQPNAVACRDNATSKKDGAGLYGSNSLLVKVARLLAIIAGVSGVFMIMLAGFKYINSSGDPSGINEAKNMILYAVVGLVIAAIAQSIILFVLNRLPG